MKKLLFCATALALGGCAQNNIDQNGSEFKTVEIGPQVWMAENLNVTHFSNGDPIPEVTSAVDWVKAGESGQPAWCHYENNPSNGSQYGKLYNWYAATDSRGLAPNGWEVPTDDHWTLLAENSGGSSQAGTSMKSTESWSGNGNGTNQTGFNVLPAGGRGGQSGFTGQGSVAVFWSATSKSRSFAWYRVFHAQRTAIFQEEDDKMSGFSIRCVRYKE